jgi:hypothetical protein
MRGIGSGQYKVPLLPLTPQRPHCAIGIRYNRLSQHAVAGSRGIACEQSQKLRLHRFIQQFRENRGVMHAATPKSVTQKWPYSAKPLCSNMPSTWRSA